MNRAVAFLAACLLPLLGTGCDYVPKPDFSFLHTQPAMPLSDVLPGRWKILYKGNTYMLTFGRHADVALVIDVPPQYRARIGVDQLWIGGNYHVENDHELNCTFTDGRWAELLAQMHGLELHHCGIKSYTEDEIVDGDDAVWKRTAKAASVRMGEAVDIADQTLTINDAPRAKTAGGKSGSAAPASMAERQANLTALFQQLEEKRKTLKVKDKMAVAAFNQEAAEYSRQLAAFNAATSATAAAR
jgi:hypothetical protein